MYMTRALSLLLVLQCCELCVTIKVPTNWDSGAYSEVHENDENNKQDDPVLPAKSQNAQKPIPIEYFEYNAPKPQFAVEIGKLHGVVNPEKHFKSYPIRPYTQEEKPQLGIHHILDKNKNIYQPYQRYVNKDEGIKTHVQPVSTGYEVFHPYKDEEPALKVIYRDPVLSKIRNDLEGSKNRLQAYEQEAGKPRITKEEYRESPDDIDRKLFPQQHVPAPYEIHRPERRPIYYKAPIRHNPREQVLNKKFRHPLNQNYVKIRPAHYQPLKNHLQQLRQHQANKYDDERNEYPQAHAVENYSGLDDGYDIYEKGTEKFKQLRNNVDESINKAVNKHQPANYKKLEFQNEREKNDDAEENEEEEEFIPIKNYAQVRKTEVVKHLPKKAAYDDAETLEEIINAPRLREAIKSAKAQTVYSEEGYEDAAYDHVGEHKQASDHEGHGGYLKEKQISGGLYKIPSVSGTYGDARESENGGKVLHTGKWKNDNRNYEDETEDDSYSEVENEQSVSDKIDQRDDADESTYRNKREDEVNEHKNHSKIESQDAIAEHDVNKREVDFEVPEINVTSTFLSEAEITKLAKKKVAPAADNTIKEKYPYYFADSVYKNSPLRYAENLKSIPIKSSGGTEFYDSRSKLECPEVENIDPIPEKLQNGENPTNSSQLVDEKGEISDDDNVFDTINQQPRLKGLGDKIDCFKAKYFGENPLDSPFFREEIILNPEPVTAPFLAAFQLFTSESPPLHQFHLNNSVNTPEMLQDVKTDIYVLLDKLRTDQDIKLQKSLNKTKEKINASVLDEVKPFQGNLTKHNGTFIDDVIENIKNNIHASIQKANNISTENILTSSESTISVAYNSYQNKEDVTKPTVKLRKKRGTPFVYEPYKIIRDGQVQDSKKTTTTSNISPLIKQLQSSRVVDRVTKSNKESDKQVKRNTRTYIDIGKKDREIPFVKENRQDPTIVDVSVDPRRGEPKYEIRPTNHKAEYTPVENKKTMSIEDYKFLTNSDNNDELTTIKNENSSEKPILVQRRSRQRKATVRPHYDVSQYIPKPTEIQNMAASNTVKKTITTLAPQKLIKKIKPNKNSEEEEYEEYGKEETSTTTKPSFRRRIRTTTTTEKSNEFTEPDVPKLKLVTRFRDYKPAEASKSIQEMTEPSTASKYKEYDITAPKYTEKKKKSSTSTLVTDTKKYGGEDEEDDEDDRRREEVDALIGVKESLDDFIPLYEQEQRNKRLKLQQSREDEDESSESEEDDSDEYNSDNDDSDEEDEEEEKEEEEEEDDESDVKVTTPEPTKRTLMRTTDAPTPTTASRSAKLEVKPIVIKKKIEIHKETPVNKSSPNVSQFKQDIEEVEIIKEIPSISKKKPQKNVDALELYKDDHLATDINKLGDVEVFSEKLDLEKGPKHGGNYRSATKEELKELAESTRPPKDAVASQSENNKHVKIDEFVPKRMHGGNLKSLSDIQRSRNTARSSKLVELNDPLVKGMHGGNLRYGNSNRGRRGGRKSEKLIELDESRENKRNNPSPRDENFKAFNPRHERLHGGNYRSAKLVQAPEKMEETKKDAGKSGRRNSAGLLSSFAQAVPILTTTPGYILDPSKRMYYYVDS